MFLKKERLMLGKRLVVIEMLSIEKIEIIEPM